MGQERDKLSLPWNLALPDVWEVSGGRGTGRGGHTTRNATFTACSWAFTSPLFPVCSFSKMEVTALQNAAWIWSISNSNSVYRNIYSSSCYRSLLLFSGSHLFSLSAVHTITILIMKIIAACIIVLLFDNIFHVQEGLLKLSSLTSHTVQASYSHRAILTANLIVELLKIPAYVHRPGCRCTIHITRDQPFSEEFLI